MKPTKRKEFKFQRSYFDVLNKLDHDSDKLSFLLAIINKQFLDEDPIDLNFIVDLSYESQRHFIEKAVKGYKDRMKTDLLGKPLIKTLPEGVMEGEGKGLMEGLPNKSKSKSKSNKEINKENDDFVTVSEFEKLHLKNRKVIPAISKSVKIPKDEVFKKLREFCVAQEATGSDQKPYSEFSRHFLNWIRKNKTTRKPSTFEQRTGMKPMI